MQTKRWNDSDSSNRYEWLVLSVPSAQSWVLPQIANLAWDGSAPHKPRSLRYLPVQLFPREKDQLSEDSLFPLAFYRALLRISSVVPSNPVLQIAFSVWQNQAKLGEPDCMLHWSDPLPHPAIGGPRKGDLRCPWSQEEMEFQSHTQLHHGCW